MNTSEVHPFLFIQEKSDLADTLGVRLSKLTYFAYVLPDSSKYNNFNIKKRDGGSREIKAPIGPLKNIQRRLSARLEMYYKPKVCAHGYIKDRNILTNAKHHKKKKWVFKVDLKDFFPSINFGRVRGILQAEPVKFPPDVATLIAQLCTVNGSLPQGAPTSPIISNLICATLDRELSCLAQKLRCHYSRYADDLTFSTNLSEFPLELGFVEIVDGKKRAVVGNALKRIITDNGFNINENKIALCGRETRQCVTGIVVNDSLNIKREYIRQVRSILHSWKAHGLQQAAQYYFTNIDKKNRPFGNVDIDFARVVRGKIQYIGLVKGWDNPVYLNLASKLAIMDSDFKHKKQIHHHNNGATANIFTEGKTDVIHLQAALKFFQAKGEFTNLSVSFAQFDQHSKGGDDFLIKNCKMLCSHPKDITTIVIGDNDSPENIKELSTEKGEYKEWGNNVFSFLIPVPEHRKGHDKLCIELLYLDEVIHKKDSNGRKLYLSSEFNPKTGKHLSEPCFCSHFSSKKLIVSTPVFSNSDDDTNLCMTKYDFASNIANGVEPFTNIDFTAFSGIFNLIDKIITATKLTKQ